jgi:small GTP-binding protein
MDDMMMIIAVVAVVAVVVVLGAVMFMRSRKARQQTPDTEPPQTEKAAEPTPPASTAQSTVQPSATVAEPAPLPVATPPPPVEPVTRQDIAQMSVTTPEPPAAPAPQPAPQSAAPTAPAFQSAPVVQPPAITVSAPAPAQAPALAPPAEATPSNVKDISTPIPSAGFEKFIKKVSLIGDGGVGKTSLINRFVQGMFSDTYIHTIGTNVKKKVVVLPDVKAEVTLMIWDLQGQRNDPYIFTHMFKTEGAVVVCDVTRDYTFNNMPEWVALLEKEIKTKVPLVFVGNKADMKEERVVSDDMLDFLAKQHKGTCLSTSAKTGENVETAFLALAKRMIGKA